MAGELILLQQCPQYISYLNRELFWNIAVGFAFAIGICVLAYAFYQAMKNL